MPQETRLAWQHAAAAALHLGPISRQQRGSLRLQGHRAARAAGHVIRHVCIAFFKQLKWISDFHMRPPSLLQHVFVPSEELLNDSPVRELLQDRVFQKHPDWEDADSVASAVSNNQQKAQQAAFTRFRENSDPSGCFPHSFPTECTP